MCVRVHRARARSQSRGRARLWRSPPGQAGEPRAARAGFVRARVPAAPRAGSQARRAPATVAGAAVAAGPKCACVRVAPRRGLVAASRCARPSSVVWRACRQRRRTPPLQTAVHHHHFFVGEPSGAPAGAQSSPESRPCELRSRLGNLGALVSLVPLDFKSDRQTGSTARSPTTSTWQFDCVWTVRILFPGWAVRQPDRPPGHFHRPGVSPLRSGVTTAQSGRVVRWVGPSGRLRSRPESAAVWSWHVPKSAPWLVGRRGICSCAIDRGALAEVDVACETCNRKDFRRQTAQGRPVCDGRAARTRMHSRCVD